MNKSTSKTEPKLDEFEKAAVGGKVWTPSSASPIALTFHPARPPKYTFRGRPLNTILDVLGVVAIWILMPLMIGFYVAMGLGAATLVVVMAWGTGSMLHADYDKSVRVESAYEQEYGYSDVDVSENARAEVTVTQTGETKEVNVFSYKGAFILYETEQQLEEKKMEVDAGTYEVLKAMQPTGK